MKNKLAGAVGGLIIAISSAAYSAPIITVLGVSWDAGSPLDFELKAGDLRETVVTGAGDELLGYGSVSFINGSSSFCAGGCDLTYVFSGYIVDEVDTTVNPQEIMFSGGSLQMYVQPSGSYNSGTPSSAVGTPAQLFLDLAGHEINWTASTGLTDTIGTLFGTFTGTLGGSEFGSGDGLFDVIGGAAAPYLNTNGEEDGADLSFSSSFQPARTPICENDTCYVLSGTGEMFGKSQAVPEPASLSLLGLGLIGIGLSAARRRKVAA